VRNFPSSSSSFLLMTVVLLIFFNFMFADKMLRLKRTVNSRRRFSSIAVSVNSVFSFLIN
jgi:hypothetical protein